MFSKPILLSLARIADFDTAPFDIQPLDRGQWRTGDYVVGEVVSSVFRPCFELCTGRMMEPALGDWIVGALGARAATLEAEGDWQSIGPDGQMQALTAAGLFGRTTSVSRLTPSFVDLVYRGHVVREGHRVNMCDFVPPEDEVAFTCPMVLLVGTSMSSGKTTAAKAIIRELKRAQLRVAGMKLTGAGRYRDILAMQDSGADLILDFVDAGLPSTICPAHDYRHTLETILRRAAQAKPDVVVAEAGASPLEPYNGDIAIEHIRPHVRLTVLCASDPYAVVGITENFGFRADLVAGVAASTSAGVAVITKLSGIKALNLMDPESHAELGQVLRERIGY